WRRRRRRELRRRGTRGCSPVTEHEPRELDAACGPRTDVDDRAREEQATFVARSALREQRLTREHEHAESDDARDDQVVAEEQTAHARLLVVVRAMEEREVRAEHEAARNEEAERRAVEVALVAALGDHGPHEDGRADQ